MEWKAGAICHPLVIQKKGGGRGLKGVQALSTTASTWQWEQQKQELQEVLLDKELSSVEDLSSRGGGRVNRPQQTPFNQFYQETGSEEVPRLINNLQENAG